MKKSITLTSILVLILGLAMANGHGFNGNQTIIDQGILKALTLTGRTIKPEHAIRSFSFFNEINGKTNVYSNKSLIGHMDEVVYKTWEGSSWVNESLEKIFFDDNGYNSETYMYTWEGNQWVNETKTIYTNNVQGLPITALMQVWEEGEWMDMMLMTISWNANNNMTEMLMQVNVGGTGWMNFMRASYTYSAQQLGLEILMQTWDFMNTVWVNESRHSFTYDANDFLIEELSQEWINNAWVDEEKKILTNNANGYVTDAVKYIWLNNAWELYLRFTYTYNAQWWLTQEKTEYWDGAGWINQTLYTSTYDAQGRIIEELEQNWVAKGWVNDYLTVYTYGLPLGIDLEKDISVSSMIFPNPAKDYLTVDLTATFDKEVSIRIIDAYGQQVEEYLLTKNPGAGYMVIPIRNIPSGQYFLIVSGNTHGRQIHKLIVQH